MQDKLEELAGNIRDACNKIRLDELTSEVAALETAMAAPGFWDSMTEANVTVGELKRIKKLHDTWSALRDSMETYAAMFPELEEKEYQELYEELQSLEKQYDAASLVLYFGGAYDQEAALMTIVSGAGGDDAEDFAGMLLRMYTMYCDSHGFSYDVLEYNEGAGEGIKKASLEIHGDYAYGTLKGERGVHRLVRLSPFKSSDSRQTSFAHVEVMPLMSKVSKNDIEIREEDLRVDTYRASGKGGQKVNKTDSAVRLTHIPTGLVAACQVERSQHQNKERALQVLMSKLYQLRLQQEAAERKEIQGDVSQVEWGRQIRSYVLHPYKMVKDHRTDVEVSQVEQVLDGNLDVFIDAEIKQLST